MQARKDPFRIRRRLAIISFIAGLIFPIMVIYFPSVAQLGIIFYSYLTFIITSYFTLATMHDNNEMKCKEKKK